MEIRQILELLDIKSIASVDITYVDSDDDWKRIKIDYETKFVDKE